MALNLVHRVRVPSGPPGRTWPAVVMVHGWLGNENVMSIFERTLPPDVVMVSPRAPLAMKPDSYGWFALEDAASFNTGLSALSTFVAELPQAYPVDLARVLLMGFSQGAAMCFSLMLNEPQRAAAVAGLAGFLPSQAEHWATPGRLTGKPVFIAHGLKDETVPVAQAQQAAATLTKAGAQVSYTEYDTGHKLNAQGTRDLKAWIERVIGK